MRREALAAIALTLFLVVLYAAFPTRNHYWDGIGFALSIEQTQSLRDVDHIGFVRLEPRDSITSRFP